MDDVSEVKAITYKRGVNSQPLTGDQMKSQSSAFHKQVEQIRGTMKGLKGAVENLFATRNKHRPDDCGVNWVEITSVIVASLSKYVTRCVTSFEKVCQEMAKERAYYEVSELK